MSTDGSRLKEAAIICDVDGTLCDVRSIRHLVERPKGQTGFRREFNRFHAESFACPAFPEPAAVLRRARALGLAIILVTGRESKWSFHTTLWLREHEIEFDRLEMRPSGDFRSDVTVKREILTRILRSFRPLLALDDREDVAAVWSASGIPTSLVTLDGSLDTVSQPLGMPLDSRVKALLGRAT